MTAILVMLAVVFALMLGEQRRSKLNEQALRAAGAVEPPDDVYAVAGKHCESGDVLIERVRLPGPRRGDVLAVPATGAYTLSMSSSYNVVPRPAAVLVADGDARLIRRRETVDDLLGLER